MSLTERLKPIAERQYARGTADGSTLRRAYDDIARLLKVVEVQEQALAEIAWASHNLHGEVDVAAKALAEAEAILGGDHD